MKTWIFVIKFLFIGALFIVSNENLYLADTDDFNQFTQLFYGWLKTLFGHIGQITSYVINVKWLPKEIVSGG